MALTRITKGVIKPNENYDTHNINSTGIVTAIGLDVNGNGDISGNLSVGGVLTYEDVTSIDSVGLITAREGIFLPDNKELKFGNTAASPDLKIYSGGTHSNIVNTNTSGYLSLNTDNFRVQDDDGNDNIIRGFKNGSVELYHGNTKRFETTAGGTIITGSLATTDTITSGEHIKTGTDDGKIMSGASNDLQLFHDGTNSIINNTEGALLFQNNGSSSMYIASDGQVSLNNDITFVGASANALWDKSENYFLIPDKIVHSGDTNTAIRFPGSDIFTIETGGSERVRVDSAGLKILDKLLHFGDIDTAIRFPAADTITAETGGSERLRITSAGKVLIGTTDQGSTSADELTIEGSGIMGMTLRTDDNSTGQSNLYFADGTSGTDRYTGYITYQHQYDRFRFAVNGGQLAVQINSDLSTNFLGNLSGGNANFTGELTVAETIGHTGDTHTKLSFPANDTIALTTGGTERLRITSNGRVSINDGTKSADSATEGATLRVTGTPVTRNDYFSPHGHYFGSIGYTTDTHTKAWLAVDSHYAQSNAVSAGIFLSAFHQDAGGSDCGYTIKNLKTGNALVFSRVKTAASTGNPAVEEERVRIHADGKVTFGASSTARATVDIFQSGQSATSLSLLVGANESGGSPTTRTNNFNKAARIACPHYTNAEEPINIVVPVSTSSENNLYWGGGTNVMNAATSHHFYTAANNTTLNGTERLRINSSGQLIMTNAATQTFADFSTTNNTTRGLISLAGKDGSGNAVTLKMGGFGDTGRGEIFTHSNHGLGFATNNAATQMMLDTGGDLLLGATSFSGFGASDKRFLINGSSNARFEFGVGGNQIGGLYADADKVVLYTSNNDYLSFQTIGNEKLKIDNTALYVKSGFPLAFLASSGPTPNIKSGGTNNQDLLFTSGSGNPERLRITSGGNVAVGGDTNSVPSKLWIYDGSNDPYIRIQRGATNNVSYGGIEIASSNGNGNNVLATMLARSAGNSGTTGSMIFQVRDQANNYEVMRLMGQKQGTIQGNRMLVEGNQVCVFGSPAGTSGNQAREGNVNTYNTVYEHSNSAFRTNDNGRFGGVFVVGGNASYWYPVWFQQPTNCPPQELWVNKYVHNYATWDGSLFFRASLCGTGYGAYTVQHRVHFYSSSSKEFIGKIEYTSHNNAYLVLWMRGGGRSYGWGTTGGNGILVTVGDDGNSHNLGPGNSAETYITNNVSIPQGYEQAMTTSGSHQQSDGF